MMMRKMSSTMIAPDVRSTKARSASFAHMDLVGGEGYACECDGGDEGRHSGLYEFHLISPVRAGFGGAWAGALAWLLGPGSL